MAIRQVAKLPQLTVVPDLVSSQDQRKQSSIWQPLPLDNGHSNDQETRWNVDAIDVPRREKLVLLCRCRRHVDGFRATKIINC
jgi:hypothetical protein